LTPFTCATCRWGHAEYLMTYSPPSRFFDLFTGSLPPGARILVLSPCQILRAMMSAHANLDVVYSRSSTLGRALLKRLGPDLVLAPVLGREHDILEIAQRLHALGFQGVLYGINPPSLQAALVHADVSAQCPGLRFHLIDRPM
jgi:hypothetical protein